MSSLSLGHYTLYIDLEQLPIRTYNNCVSVFKVYPRTGEMAQLVKRLLHSCELLGVDPRIKGQE